MIHGVTMKKFDIAGASCSGLCICHCLLTPLLMASGSFGGSLLLLESEWLHRFLLIPVLMLALLTVLSIVRRQADWYLLILVAAGVGMMLSAIFYEERFGGDFEQTATVIGGCVLIVFHLMNRHKSVQLVTVNVA